MRKANPSPGLTETELRDLAGLPPMSDLEFQETWDIRHTVWKALKGNKRLVPRWINHHVKNTILGYHHTACRVVGVTRLALDRLAGPREEFDVRRETNTYQRAHLYPRRLVNQLILGLDHNTTRDQLVDWIWHKDITILSLRQENDLLENRDYYLANALTFRNDAGKLFQDTGGSYTYGKPEKSILKELKTLTSSSRP